MTDRYHNLRWRQGFTLIEVLVVVAIIALLISILLPSLQRAREQTRNTLCLSNLHNFGVSMNTFAAQNKGKVPVGGDPMWKIHWVSVVAKEMQLVKRMTKWMTVNNIRVDKLEIFQCPSRTASGSKKWLGYVCNSMNPDGPAGSDWNPLPHGEDQLTSINLHKQPAEVVYVADAEKESAFEAPTYDPANPLGARINWEFALNQGYLDGSEAGYHGIESSLGNYNAPEGQGKGGGIDTMDVWRTGQLPMTQNNPNGGPGRRVANKLHLRRYTNAVFWDGHGGPVKPPSADASRAFEYWMRKFGLTRDGIQNVYASASGDDR